MDLEIVMEEDMASMMLTTKRKIRKREQPLRV
jgi:hypothetical protein